MIKTLSTAAALAAILSACQSGGYPSGTPTDASTGSGSAAVSGTGIAEGGTYHLQTNLHADPVKNQLYSTNYQQALLLPIGTQVRVDSVGKKTMEFTISDTGVTYKYTRDKHLVEPFAANLARYFGADDPTGKITALSEVDKQGITDGMAKVGMSKDGVILACGYPPDHGTPSTEAVVWTYWGNRWVRKLIHFDANGIVSQVQQ